MPESHTVQTPDLGHANLLQGTLSFELINLGGT